MVKRNVFYVVEVTNNVEWEPKLAFYNRNSAEEYLTRQCLPLFNGCNGFKIEEGQEKSGVKAFDSYEAYIKNDRIQKIKELKEEIQRLEEERE